MDQSTFEDRKTLAAPLHTSLRHDSAHKHVTGQAIDATTIVREYPAGWTPGAEPFYPVPAPDAKELYLRYAVLAAAEANVSFIGRLATYRYYNMDQVTGMALAEAGRLISRYSSSTHD